MYKNVIGASTILKLKGEIILESPLVYAPYIPSESSIEYLSKEISDEIDKEILEIIKMNDFFRKAHFNIKKMDEKLLI